MNMLLQRKEYNDIYVYKFIKKDQLKQFESS